MLADNISFMFYVKSFLIALWSMVFDQQKEDQSRTEEGIFFVKANNRINTGVRTEALKLIDAFCSQEYTILFCN